MVLAATRLPAQPCGNRVRLRRAFVPPVPAAHGKASGNTLLYVTSVFRVRSLTSEEIGYGQ
jgi:hypothetical protein